MTSAAIEKGTERVETEEPNDKVAELGESVVNIGSGGSAVRLIVSTTRSPRVFPILS